MSILNDYHRDMVKLQYTRILNTPEGRTLGRWFLTEIGKGPEGNIGKLIKEIQDIEAEVIRGLYSSPAPVQSR